MKNTVFLNDLRAVAVEYNVVKGVEFASRYVLDLALIKAEAEKSAFKGHFNIIVELENVGDTLDNQRAYRDYLLERLLVEFEEATVNRQKYIFVVYVSWEEPEEVIPEIPTI